MLHEEDFEIVRQYGAELRGLTNYYTMAVNVSRIVNRIKSVMMASLVKTLAGKHKAKTTAIYRKHSVVFDNGLKGIMVEIKREGKQILTAKFGETPIRYQRIIIGPKN